jgi:hypothetical protein
MAWFRHLAGKTMERRLRPPDGEGSTMSKKDDQQPQCEHDWVIWSGAQRCRKCGVTRR